MYKIELDILDLSKIYIFTDLNSVYETIKNRPDKLTKTIPITNININKTDKVEMYKYKYNTIILLDGFVKNMFYNKEDNITFMVSPDDDMRFPDLVYTLIVMFANNLIEQRKYLIHSSAIKYDDDKAIILTGDANSGKSSLAFKLMDTYGYKLISNDHTLIGLENDKLTAYTGTKELEMREGILKDSFNDYFVKLGLENDKDVWSRKLIINDSIPQDLISTDDKAIVTDIFQIDIISRGKSFIKTKEYVDQRLYLYEQLSKIIKGTYNLITGFSYPMPSIESYDRMCKVDEDVRNTLLNTEIHMAKGTLNGVSKEMVKVLAKK